MPVGASSGMVVWKVADVKAGTLSLTSSTSTVTVPVPLKAGDPRKQKTAGRAEKDFSPISHKIRFNFWFTICLASKNISGKKSQDSYIT